MNETYVPDSASFNAELIHRLSACESINRRIVIQTANGLAKEKQEAMMKDVIDNLYGIIAAAKAARSEGSECTTTGKQ